MRMDGVLHSFAYCIDFLAEQVGDVSDADMVAQPNGIANHPAWVIGHLTYICQQIGAVIGVAPWLPHEWAGRFGTGSRPVPDAKLYEPKHKALAILRDAQVRLTRAVEQLAESRLEEPFPEPSYRDVLPSIGHALTQVLVGHSAYHVGQVGTWRRAMGLPALGRAFE